MNILFHFRTLFLVIAICTCQFSFCQGWEKTFSNTNDVLSFQLKESYDAGFIIAADIGINGYLKIGWIIKTDVNGNILWEKKLGNGFTFWSLQGIDITSDGGMVVVGITDTIFSQNNPFVIKLNSCGNIEWCHIYPFLGVDNDGIKILKIQDDTYTFIHLIHTSPNKIWLTHINQTGEILWDQQYFLSDSLIHPFAPRWLNLTSNQNYLITGVCYAPDTGYPNQAWVHPMLIMADTSGEVIWEIPWGSNIHIGGEGYQSVDNGSVIFSSMCNYAHPPDSFYHPAIFKTSINGEELGYKILNNNTRFGKASTLTKLSDSIFLTGAGYQLYSGENNLSVFKIDTAINIYKEKILNHSEYVPTDAILTRDQKYLIVSDDYISNKYVFHLWKLNKDLEYDSIYTQPHRYDSLCPDTIQSSTLFFQCDVEVGIQEQVINSEKVRMHIYPNPANEILHVEMPEFLQKESKTGHFTVTTIFHQWNKNLWLQVFDLMGRLVYQQMVKPGEKEVMLNVSAWSSGMYYFRLVYGDTMVASEKVIVE